jgi:hypothetical protein
MNRAEKISYACRHCILTGCRYKQPHKKWVLGVSIKGQIGWSMKLEKTSVVVLRMIEFFLNIAWHCERNIQIAEDVLRTGRLSLGGF